MAGYVLKIVIEDTHPPVWRRIVIPEKITFEELHEVIQTIFGWTGAHLHDFRIPSADICIDDGREMWSMYQYKESETLVEEFLFTYNWIRYTYDFGDEWRHKIFYEKTDEDYNERFTSLRKVKGDNFCEDIGGVWGDDGSGQSRCAFAWETVEQRLKNLVFPVHEQSKPKDSREWMEEDLEKATQRLIAGLVKRMKGKHFGSLEEMPSVMAQKADAWKQFLENSPKEQTGKTESDEKQDYSQMVLPLFKEEDLKEPDYTLKIVQGAKTNVQLLQALSGKETDDYCKYLQIPVQEGWTKNQKIDAVSQEFQKHPEYLLYVLEEEEYRGLLRLMKAPCGHIEIPQGNDMLLRALALGLADITVEKKKGKTRAQLIFAADAEEILRPLNEHTVKQVYRKLEKISKKLDHIVFTYGLIDFDHFYMLFCKIYREKLSREDFCRYVYWHMRFNNLVQTSYRDDGICYAAAVGLDMESLIEQQERYAKDLDYVLFPADELRKMTEDISERNTWLDILFTTLHFRLHFPEDEAAQIIEGVFTKIMDGENLPWILDAISRILPADAGLEERGELWEVVSSLMLELELPMLKGRSRTQYAQEKEISPWEVGMIDRREKVNNTKDAKLYEFPAKIQEAMYLASVYRSKENMETLWQYMEQEKIVSEEYIYQLAFAYAASVQPEKADVLIEMLKKSSRNGKRAAKNMTEILENGMDIMDDEDDFWNEQSGAALWDAIFGSDWMDEQEDFPKPQTYVRETPKIGRNDPCPCGSGKKYKKCCGRNK